MRSSRGGVARSPMEPSGADPASITDRDDPHIAGPAAAGIPGGTGRTGTPQPVAARASHAPADAGTAPADAGTAPADASTAPADAGTATDADAELLTESDAEAQAHGICFKTGPPCRVGVELEWLVCDSLDPAAKVDQRRVTAALAALAAPGALPGAGVLTTEPGGQIALSSAPAASPGHCLAAACQDLAAVRKAVRAAGLCLTGQGIDPFRPPRRVLDLPRYAAMEEFFDRAGPWGRLMMCSTASVQVCLDAGDEGPGWAGFRWRWHLLHAIGPVLVAAFANSPLRGGRPTGWKSTRQAIWSRLDPTRTRPPAHAEPPPAGQTRRTWPPPTDPRSAWVAYALAAQVMCVRRPGDQGWSAPAGLTFRDWLRGAGERPPTRGDLVYHLSTLFPPVRPRGHLEFRGIDAQPDEGWIVPLAVLAALLDDPLAAQQAMAAAEPLWHQRGRAGGEADAASLWLRAARHGPADPALAAAGRRCFEAAEAALARMGAPTRARQAVTVFAEHYVDRDRCPADDLLDPAHAGSGPCSGSPLPSRRQQHDAQA